MRRLPKSARRTPDCLHRVRIAAKRYLDLLLASLALVATSPLIVAITILVRSKHGSPVLFRQARPGTHGVLFVMFKFRTMSDVRDTFGHLLPDGERLTTLGRFLRATSLDELPELVNVLKGDMAIVGPRPLLAEYLRYYTPEQARRHNVRPGITGWAQVNGRNSLSWEERFDLDTWYVDHWSLWLDFRIVLYSVLTVIRHEGISAAGHSTMPAFGYSGVTTLLEAQPTRRQ